MDATLLVRRALLCLQEETTLPEGYFTTDFTIICNGALLGSSAFRKMLATRKAHTKESHFAFLEMVGRGSDVGVVRSAQLTTDDGTTSTVLTLDVWHLEDGLIASAWQCWQLVPGPASDDLPVSPREGLFSETVREALEGLAQLQAAELFVAQFWAGDFSGVVDGVRMDAAALHRHVAALQESLESLVVDVKHLVAHGTAVGACYHMSAVWKKGGGARSEVCVVAVFSCRAALPGGVSGGAGLITGCHAVSRVEAGGEEGERLASLMLPVAASE